ncbi:Putative ABC transporter substrate-binding protein YesO [Paenibacillus solanacearum]|uniref:ABC transporter substrate-binding protein YesO n=1 Tax=Paenibacillus solanacearum TaxID=2048548 RepID=A0A916K6I9_9BACL|nr:extracellular solute-binding protein [Paenibacillus solanacearum]CAG7648644.1 Putative ABC transporter substrate-binding protein YesO [Paenibacillus solanacearum]
MMKCNYFLSIRKASFVLMIGSLCAGALAGCGEPDKPAAALPDMKPKEPIELTLAPYFLNMTDAEFEEVLIKPLQAKYPHISLKVVRDDITKLVSAGQTPDIVYSANSRFSVLQELDIPYDLSAFVKTYNMDLNQFSSPNIDWIKELGTKGEIYGVPFGLNQMALFYNKDLFDKRGVAYPKDGITWDEYFELTKKLTYNDGGVQYRGSLPPNPEFISRMKSMSLVDAKTNKALVNNDAFRNVMDLVQAFYQIPGMVQDGQKLPAGSNHFVKDLQMAMYLNWIPDTVGFIQQSASSMNFDLVGAPAFKDKPGLTIDHGAQMMVVSKSSQHKEEAFQAIQLFASPAVQNIMNRKSRLTVLADESLTKQFLADVEVTKGKNIQGALKVKSAKMAPPNPYHVIVAGKVNAAAETFATGAKDINTVLRETQEEADKAIEQELAKKKK